MPPEMRYGNCWMISALWAAPYQPRMISAIPRGTMIAPAMSTHLSTGIDESDCRVRRFFTAAARRCWRVPAPFVDGSVVGRAASVITDSLLERAGGRSRRFGEHVVGKETEPEGKSQGQEN